MSVVEDRAIVQVSIFHRGEMLKSELMGGNAASEDSIKANR
jgi:hypothetical protein